MASKYSNIKKAIEELKFFLDTFSGDYYEAEKNIKHGQGWIIPFYKDELFMLVNNMVPNLYEGLYPKLLEDNPATDEEILGSINGILDYLEKNIILFQKIVDKKKAKGDEPVLDTVEGIVQDLVTKAIYKLRQVINIANREKAEIINASTLIVDKFDIAIVSALFSTEYEALLNLPLDFELYNVANDSTNYRATYIGSKRVLIATDNKMGMPEACALSSKIIAKFSPTYLFMCGICGGVKDNEKEFGDILIATTTWNYDSGKRKFNRKKKQTVFEPDPKQAELDPILFNLVNDFNRNRALLREIHNDFKKIDETDLYPSRAPKIFCGPIASGSAVLADEREISKIRQAHRKLIGIDMETYGVMYAAKSFYYNQQTHAMSVKSISDFADEQKNDRYRNYAAYTSAHFVYRFILEKLQN
jgi:nucleoside phosphorylase